MYFPHYNRKQRITTWAMGSAAKTHLDRLLRYCAYKLSLFLFDDRIIFTEWIDQS